MPINVPLKNWQIPEFFPVGGGGVGLVRAGASSVLRAGAGAGDDVARASGGFLRRLFQRAPKATTAAGRVADDVPIGNVPKVPTTFASQLARTSIKPAVYGAAAVGGLSLFPWAGDQVGKGLENVVDHASDSLRESADAAGDATKSLLLPIAIAVVFLIGIVLLLGRSRSRLSSSRSSPRSRSTSTRSSSTKRRASS